MPIETSQLFRETYGRTLEPDVLADVDGPDGGLGGIAAARPRRAPRPHAGRDPQLRPQPHGRRPGAVRLPRRGGRRRPAAGPAGLPDADVDPPGRHTRARRGRGHRARRGRGRRASRLPRSESPCWGGGPAVRERSSGITRWSASSSRRASNATLAVDAVRDLHRTVAAHAAGRDWRIAAHHHWAAGDRDDARAIIDASARSIIGRGEYLVAAPFVADVDDEALRASFLVVLSRRDFKQGDVRQALARAKRAVEIDPGSDVALANLASLNLTSGDVVGAVEAATRLIAATTDEGWLGIARTMLAIVQGSRDGPIPDTIEATLRPRRAPTACWRYALRGHFPSQPRGDGALYGRCGGDDRRPRPRRSISSNRVQAERR